MDPKTSDLEKSFKGFESLKLFRFAQDGLPAGEWGWNPFFNPVHQNASQVRFIIFSISISELTKRQGLTVSDGAI